MTVLSVLPKSASHILVRLSDGTEILSTLNTLADLRISEGVELNDTLLEELRSVSERDLGFEKASEIALRRLISRKELRTKLLQKGISEENCDFCINKLLRFGILNDEVYAEAIVRHYASKGYGQAKIKTELLKRGISRDLWEDAFRSMPENDDKIEQYLRTHLSDPGDRSQVQKVSGALYRRGFSWDEIHTALRRFEAAEEDYSWT